MLFGVKISSLLSLFLLSTYSIQLYSLYFTTSVRVNLKDKQSTFLYFHFNTRSTGSYLTLKTLTLKLELTKTSYAQWLVFLASYIFVHRGDPKIRGREEENVTGNDTLTLNYKDKYT